MFSSTLRGAATIAGTLGDRLDEPPDGSRWTKWLIGVALAALPFALGVFALIGGRRMGMAVFWLSLGMFVHFHYFWGLSKRLGPYSQLAKSVAAIPLMCTIVYGVFYALAFR
jgi:hypothetical protein